MMDVPFSFYHGKDGQLDLIKGFYTLSMLLFFYNECCTFL